MRVVTVEKVRKWSNTKAGHGGSKAAGRETES